MTNFIAFDGNQCVTFVGNTDAGLIGSNLPVKTVNIEKPIDAQLFASPEKGDIHFSRPGLQYVLDNTREGNLTELATKGHERGGVITTERSPDGRFDYITVVDDTIRTKMTYDREKHCVTAYERFTVKHEANPWQKSEFKLVKIDEIWLPELVRFENTIDHHVEMFTFSNWKVNVTIPDDRFKFAFPKRTMLNDHVRKMRYRVGEPINEEAAAREYRALNRSSEPPATSWYQSGWTWVIGTSCIAALIVFFMTMRRRIRPTFS